MWRNRLPSHGLADSPACARLPGASMAAATVMAASRVNRREGELIAPVCIDAPGAIFRNASARPAGHQPGELPSREAVEDGGELAAGAGGREMVDVVARLDDLAVAHANHEHARHGDR